MRVGELAFGWGKSLSEASLDFTKRSQITCMKADKRRDRAWSRIQFKPSPCKLTRCHSWVAIAYSRAEKEKIPYQRFIRMALEQALQRGKF
jgi:hypothetical protein